MSRTASKCSICDLLWHGYVDALAKLKQSTFFLILSVRKLLNFFRRETDNRKLLASEDLLPKILVSFSVYVAMQ